MSQRWIVVLLVVFSQNVFANTESYKADFPDYEVLAKCMMTPDSRYSESLIIVNENVKPHRYQFLGRNSPSEKYRRYQGDSLEHYTATVSPGGDVVWLFETHCGAPPTGAPGEHLGLEISRTFKTVQSGGKYFTTACAQGKFKTWKDGRSAKCTFKKTL